MKRIGKYTIWIGILIMAVAPIYDIVFVGIPYQDPPIALQNKYEQKQKIASKIESWTTPIGLTLVVAGGLIILGDSLRRTLNKRTPGGNHKI